MPPSLLALPCELREQILISLLQSESIKLQQPAACKNVYTPPISQVCRLLRDHAIGIFYHINSFIWLIDPEAVGLTFPQLPKRTCVTLQVTDTDHYQVDIVDPARSPLPTTAAGDGSSGPINHHFSMLPWHRSNVATDLRHVRLDLYLPDPYDKRLWNMFAGQLAQLADSVANGKKLRELRVLIATWHRFRELSDQHIEVLKSLGQLSVKGRVQVRTRSLDGKLRAVLQNLGLTSKLRDDSVSGIGYRQLGGSCVDWQWDGGVDL